MFLFGLVRHNPLTFFLRLRETRSPRPRPRMRTRCADRKCRLFFLVLPTRTSAFAVRNFSCLECCFCTFFVPFLSCSLEETAHGFGSLNSRGNTKQRILQKSFGTKQKTGEVGSRTWHRTSGDSFFSTLKHKHVKRKHQDWVFGA